MPDAIREPINLFRRIAGVGTILLGAFALTYCVAYIGELWNTPQRSLAIFVTTASVLMMFIGTAIGFPELLPKKIVAVIFFFFGVLTMAVGLATLGWVAYNLFVDQQKEFRMGNLRFPFLAIGVGFGIAAKSCHQLRHRAN